MIGFLTAAIAAQTGEFASAARLVGYARRWREERAFEEAGDFGVQSSVETLLAGGMTNEERRLIEHAGANLDKAAVAELIRRVVSALAGG